MTLSTLLRGSVYERLRWTFKLYDINGDGCIGRNELAKLIQAVHELMGRRPHQPDDDRKAREQVNRSAPIYRCGETAAQNHSTACVAFCFYNTRANSGILGICHNLENRIFSPEHPLACGRYGR